MPFHFGAFVEFSANYPPINGRGVVGNMKEFTVKIAWLIGKLQCNTANLVLYSFAKTLARLKFPAGI